MTPTLNRITIFPIKSLDGCDVDKVTVLANGALANDRRYALVDQGGKLVNGKQCVGIHSIRATYDEDFRKVTLRQGEQFATFLLPDEGEKLAAWCSKLLHKKCRFVENANEGFPDDCEAPGPTLISTASLTEVATSFDGIDLAEVRRRFRMNLEIDSDVPFWEDQLIAENRNKIFRFQIGKIIWQGRGACQRCIVPSRDSQNGVVSSHFSKIFAKRRQDSLPGWAPTTRFDHFYRLGVNTGLESVENGNTLRLGDPLCSLV